MKKILPILMLAFTSLFIVSCDNTNDNVQTTDSDTISQAFDVVPNFTRINDNLYRFSDDFQKPLVESDMVLIYMQNGVDGDSPIWKLLPYTYYVDSVNAVDYLFDFSKYGATININSSSTFSLTANPSFYQNIKFRVVIIPANASGTGGKGVNNIVDYNDYKSVIKYYNINESNIKTKVK